MKRILLLSGAEVLLILFFAFSVSCTKLSSNLQNNSGKTLPPVKPVPASALASKFRYQLTPDANGTTKVLVIPVTH